MIRPLDLRVEEFAAAVNVAVPTIFQAAFQLWLAHTSPYLGKSLSTESGEAQQTCYFDYLLTGRNVDLPDPQTINGNCANFLPLKASLASSKDLESYLNATQALFWEATEKVWVGLDDIYGSSNCRNQVGNQVMFLFQPFEPQVPAGREYDLAGGEDDYIYVNLAKSEVHMMQPYALVVEIAKASTGRHRIKVMWDKRLFSEVDAERLAVEVSQIVEFFVDNGVKLGIGEIDRML